MKFWYRPLVATILTLTVAGCGGGHGLSENLGSFAPGATWVYKVSGNVNLSAALGGGNQGLQPSSTFTVKVTSDTVKDAANLDVNVMTRRFNLVLLDGRTLNANLRLFVTQESNGLFIHGINESESDTLDPANTHLVSSTSNPPFKFLYYPSPASPGRSVSYTDPLAIGRSYSFALHSNPRQTVHVPAGDFRAYVMDQVEGLTLQTTTAAFTPEVGVVAGNVTATLPDGSQFNGTITLLSVKN